MCVNTVHRSPLMEIGLYLLAASPVSHIDHNTVHGSPLMEFGLYLLAASPVSHIDHKMRDFEWILSTMNHQGSPNTTLRSQAEHRRVIIIALSHLPDLVMYGCSLALTSS